MQEMEPAKKDVKHGWFSNKGPKKKRYSDEKLQKKNYNQEIQRVRPRDAKLHSKGHKIMSLREGKQRKILDKRRKREQERERQRTERRIRGMGEQVHLPTCQALNRLEKQCKSKVLDKSKFCKIHQFCDSAASGLLQCLGRNKRLKRCIKSVPADEKYCNYHKNKNK